MRQIGSDTFNLAYDAENRLVEVKKNGASIAQFVYDGDGKRVQSTINGVTTVFVGAHFELTGSTVTKYYFAGATRIATPALAPGASVRKYTIPQNMTVEYLLGDHLGSTNITTDANGAKVSEIRYKPWGEIRYAWTSHPSTTPAYTLPSYTFTGQYSYLDDPSTSGVTEGFGLMFYNARWYDPYLSRFAQPDTLIPEQSQGTQAWDRYAYVNNNPLRYVDPSGHTPACGFTYSDPECNVPDPWKPMDVPLSKRALQLIDFSKSVGMTPEDVIGIGLGHEMFYDSEDEQAIHMQAFRNGFIQYADANCNGNRTYNCMLNYFSGYQSVKGQFDKYWGKPVEYEFDQELGNLSDNMRKYVTTGKEFMKDFMSTISQYSYDPVHNPADLDLAVNTGVVNVSEFLALNMGHPSAAMGFLIVKPATCPNGPGYTLVYNWYGQDFLDNHGISACE